MSATPEHIFIRAFDRFANPVDTMNPYIQNIDLLSSSSSGNSAFFKHERVLIDLGLTHKAYMQLSLNFFKQIDYIFLTHEHIDHLNPATLRTILKTEPHIKVLIHTRLLNKIRSPEWHKKIKPEIIDKYIKSNQLIELNSLVKLTSRSIGEFMFIPHVTNHGDTTNIAIELKTKYHHMLYATDLSTIYPSSDGLIQGLPTPHFTDLFDLICLEANYNTEILEEYINERNRRLAFSHTMADISEKDTRNELLRAKSNKRHLSEEESWDYASRYLKPNGIYIPLHASKEFGTLQQLTIY